MAEGWISLHRKIMDSDLWQKETFDRAHAWIDLLLLANHKPGYFYCRGVKVMVQRGQVGYGSRALGKRWQWSKNKVIKFLQDLEKESQIRTQKTNVTTLITIVNYEFYQGEEGRRRDTEGTQKGQNNNVNNIYTPHRQKITELSTGVRTCIEDDFYPSQATIDFCAARQLPDPTDRQALDDFIHTNQSSHWQSANWDAEYRKFLPKWRLRNDKEAGKPKRNRAERYFDLLNSIPESD